jgi:precorrin-3B C17-methyltransferase/precorrin-6y C5,15-methyltransferase (decarboxylating) CbiE subunit/precorrin-6Y C5,15-methyltransferase (decarboxylating) CbiT subunit
VADGPTPAGAPVHVVGLLGGRPVGDAAVAALAGASLVAGGADQLAGVADLLAPGTATAVVGAGLGALDAVAAHDGRACVLASGDPGFHGIGRALAARLGPERLVVHPAPTSVALAFARLGLPWAGAAVASCHTGGAARAAAQVAAAPCAAVLCGPAAPPEAVGTALVTLGAHHAGVAVATRLGEPGESVHRLDGVAALAAGRFDHRSVVVLTDDAPAEVAPAGRGSGRPVADFVHRRGMITKPEVRSVVLGRLDLPERGVLWDVGAGSGSLAVEAALVAPGLRVLAVEHDPDAAEAVVANAAALGAVVEVVTGAAPAALAGLPAPDRVFVGGGGLEVLDACLAAARPGARIVATYAAADRALAARERLGSLAQVSVDVAAELPDGGVRFVADNPVFVAWGDVAGGSVAGGARHGRGAGVRGVAAGSVADAGPAAAGAVAPVTPVVAVGVGCSTTATADEVGAVVAEALAAAGRPTLAGADLHVAAGGHVDACGDAAAGSGADVRVDAVATVDRRLDHPALAGAAPSARRLGFPADLLATVGVPTPSDLVDAAVGTPSVAEAAALLAAGPGARLVVDKHRGPTATAAVAVGGSGPRAPEGVVRVVGLGPGAAEHRTPAAVRAVRSADAVIGYRPYVDMVGPLLRPEQLVVRSAMGAEAPRAEQAVALAAAGWAVAVVSSGDPGTFAMASVTLEVAAGRVAVEVVPGVTAAGAGAAATGAPLAGPHAALTLSDILVPWPTIERQLRAAAGAGLALALFNPRSAGRPDHLARARTVLADVLGPAVPVTVVTDATGPDEVVTITTLGELDPALASMRSIVLVGTADTVVTAGRLVTRRHHPRPSSAPDAPGTATATRAATATGAPTTTAEPEVRP